ncbi:MAG: glycine--tRNA ligase subunit beta [Thermodesulfobacteriota bacterium]|nr:glycine--tRNA ligase subunit beta [Thermodesulfobacteriota bacterium]
MSELLLEIGTEEIPSGFIPRALEDMKALLEREFQSNRLSFNEVKALGTPRRLVFTATGVAPSQERRLLEVIGPAKHLAFDGKDRPTRAALGFARGQGIAVEELQVVKTERGEYVCARKEEEGKETFDLLPLILPRLISSISFPKSMRWMDLENTFARPIHWILALFDGKIVPFQVGNISSGNLSRGHRFMAPGSFQVKDLGDYIRKLKNSFVIINPEERKEYILAEVNKAAGEVSGHILIDNDLLEIVTHLVEYPVPIRGSFSKEFLSLPREVLISAMREHQRYFSIVDAKGNLLPFFVTISNTKPRDPNVVARGNERVLQARLSDAKFFFLEDQKGPLIQRLEGLKKVVYHSKLGTSYEKVMRLSQLADFLCGNIAPDLREIVKRASLLCKGDLITGMVGEFPSLQGIMGRVYARLSGEEEEVAQAIYEHYQPITAGGDIPSSHPGAVLSIADKLDTIVGCFGINLIPTGTADPYALRRQTLGIIHIILERRYLLSLSSLLERSMELLSEKIERPPLEIKADVLEFFRGRLQNLLNSKGLSADAVEAALAVGFDDLVDLQERAKALHDLKKAPDFEPLAIAFKRVVNISKSHVPGEVDVRLFESAYESGLLEAYEKIGLKAEEKIIQKDYPSALKELSLLRTPVDEFFNGVLVMAEDEKVKTNRLSLLCKIAKLFFKVGDFSKITTG